MSVSLVFLLWGAHAFIIACLLTCLRLQRRSSTAPSRLSCPSRTSRSTSSFPARARRAVFRGSWVWMCEGAASALIFDASDLHSLDMMTIQVSIHACFRSRRLCCLHTNVRVCVCLRVLCAFTWVMMCDTVCCMQATCIRSSSWARRLLCVRRSSRSSSDTKTCDQTCVSDLACGSCSGVLHTVRY